MTNSDIRWKQRFHNFSNALAQLTDANALSHQRALSRLEQQGLIKAFEFTYELAWNTMKDYLAYQGIVDLIGSRDTTREAFKQGLIEDGEGWMMMLADRNRSSHTYNAATALEIILNVQSRYVALFLAMSAKLAQRLEDE